MKKFSEEQPDWDYIRDQFLGLNESLSVKSYYPQMRKLLDELEDKVKERTSQLEAAINVLRDTQDRLVYSEKMAALGRLSAGVAHELNSPLAAIESLSTGLFKNVRKIVIAFPKALKKIPIQMTEDFFRVMEDLAAKNLEKGLIGNREKRRKLVADLEKEKIREAEQLADAVDSIDAYDAFYYFKENYDIDDVIDVFSALTASGEIISSTLAIKNAAERVAAVIRSMKSYGMMVNDDLQLDMDNSVALDHVIQNSLNLYSSKFQTGIRLSTALEENIFVKADAGSLSQVFISIISNAIHAVASNGSLFVHSHKQGSFAFIDFEDDGAGIAEEAKEKVFEPFYTTKPVGEGSGFDLVIARRIVEELGGSITFESKPGRTVFTVKLPLSS